MSYLNKVIQFVYDGGSKPGTGREIFVTDETPSHISGVDITCKVFRKFLVRNMRTIKTLESIVLTVDPVNVDPTTYLYLEETFQKNGYKTLLTNTKFVATIILGKNLNIEISRKNGKTEFWKDGVYKNSCIGLSTSEILKKVEEIIDNY